jgi:hypothetical protein
MKKERYTFYILFYLVLDYIYNMMSATVILFLLCRKLYWKILSLSSGSSVIKSGL